MKNSLLLICFLTVVTFSFAQSDQAKVNKVQGKYVFYFNEPINEYEVVFTFKTDPLTACETIDGIVNAMLKAATYEAGAQGKQFDAIIVGTTDRDLAIKFKDPAKDNSFATVKRNDGKYYFIFSEPAGAYEVVEKIKVFRSNQMTGQCRSVMNMVEEVLKDASKAEKKGKKYAGIVIGNDQFHNSITF